MQPTTKNEFDSLVARIAEILPGSWELRPYEEDWGARIVDPDLKAEISIRAAEWKKADRISIRSWLPKDAKGEEIHLRSRPYGKPMPSITVSGSKDAPQIARDIERRLLPEYLPLLEEARQGIAERDDYAARTEASIKAIAGFLKVPAPREGKKVDFYHSPLPAFHENLGEAKADGDEIDLDLRGLDVETALLVLNFLKERG